MCKMKKCIISSLILLFIIAKPAFGMKVSGTVLSVRPASSPKANGTVGMEVGAVTDTGVKAVTSKEEVIAESRTDAKGIYSMTIPEDRKDDVFLICADTPAGFLRAFFSGEKTDVNLLTEIIAGRILDSGVQSEYFTSNERNLIFDRLSAISAPLDLSDMRTATDAIVFLLDRPDFNLALGDLTATYAMPDDNVSHVEAISNSLNGFIQGFNANDKDLVRNSLAPNIKIFIGEKGINDIDNLLGIFDELHDSHNNIKLQSESMRVKIDKDNAEVISSEHLQMASKENGSSNVDETFIMRNKLVNSNGKWLLSEREASKCTVVKAAIKTDGHIADWLGISPCYYQKPDAPAGDADHDSITAMYFARDDVFLYWRMDLNMAALTPISPAPAMQSIPRGIYYLFLVDKSQSPADKSFVNFINYEISGAASTGRIGITENGGKDKESYFRYTGFSVGSQSIEGSIPLEDIAFLNKGIYAFGKATRRVKPGMPANPDLVSGNVEIVF
jgi:hypothetical protein